MGNWLLSFTPGFLPSCLSVGVSMKTSSLNKFPGMSAVCLFCPI